MPTPFIGHYTLWHFLRHEEQEYCNDFLFFYLCLILNKYLCLRIRMAIRNNHPVLFGWEF